MTTRILSLVLCLAVVATALAPVAQAQSQLNVKSVGEIFVDAAGRATGDNVNGLLVEANGLITQYTSASLGMKIFESVAIEGFTQAEKIQGVGSSVIVLRGSNAVVSLTDNIQSTLRVQATSETNVNFAMAKDVTAKTGADAKHQLDLVASSGAYLGSLVITSADGEASSKSAFAAGAAGEMKAHLEKGSQVVFHARPVYVDGRALSDATASALAQGWLAASVVTEFSGSAEAKSETNYFSDSKATTDAAAANGVTTTVTSKSTAAAIVAYDLAYESLPAAKADDVSVYMDGSLAKRVETANDVVASAKAGVPAYYTTANGGRTQVLASTADFSKTASHSLSVLAKAAAQSQAQASSQAASEASSSVYGELQYYANGKLTGEFLSGIVSQNDASVHDYTSIPLRTEIFESYQVVGDAFTGAAAQGHAMVFTGAKADVTMVDDAYGSVMIEAKQAAQVDFDLGANVKAVAESANVVRLEGPHGYVGALILARGAAEATATSKFVTTAEGHVLANLDARARLIFRSSTEVNARADASAQVIARAIAEGKIAGHVLAGVENGAIATSDMEYYASAAIEVVAEAKGDYDIDYKSDTTAAFLFEARGGAALAAKTTSDIQVFVEGRAATAVSAPELVFSASGAAKYWVETTIDGKVLVLVNAGAAAAGGALVEVKSKLDSAAKAQASQDAFGQFKMFADGLAVGSFVSLKTDQRAGIVNDVRMLSNGQQVFSSVQAGASAFASAGAEGASTLALENREARLEFSDTTSALMKLVAKTETDARYKLGAGMTATAASSSVIELASKDGSYLGTMIITDGEGRAAANSGFANDAALAAYGEVKAHLEAGAQMIFKTHVGIETELTAAERALMNQAIAAGHVGGQVFVQTQASLSAAAQAALAAQSAAEGTGQGALVSAAEAQGSVTAAITAAYYNDVQLVTAAVKDRVDVTVSSTLTMGKTIIVSLDKDTISGMATGDAEILVDGHASTQAESYADILNPNDDGGVYEYFVLAGEAGTQVLVSVPHFSTHTVTLKAREPSTPPVFMYATVFLGVLVVAETVVIVRRRWS